MKAESLEQGPICVGMTLAHTRSIMPRSFLY
jgi:hypothetical protein